MQTFYDYFAFQKQSRRGPSGTTRFQKGFQKGPHECLRRDARQTFCEVWIIFFEKQPQDQTFGQLPKCAVVKPQVATKNSEAP